MISTLEGGNVSQKQKKKSKDPHQRKLDKIKEMEKGLDLIRTEINQVPNPIFQQKVNGMHGKRFSKLPH